MKCREQAFAVHSEMLFAALKKAAILSIFGLNDL